MSIPSWIANSRTTACISEGLGGGKRKEEEMENLKREEEIDNWRWRDIEREDVAFVRCGFPVYDRVGYHRYGIMGYHGGIYLTDMITNAILEWGER